jgi:hypothetical protein
MSDEEECTTLQFRNVVRIKLILIEFEGNLIFDVMIIQVFIF